jgi:hypothetical protein
MGDLFSQLLLWALVAAVLIWAISFAIRSALRHQSQSGVGMSARNSIAQALAEDPIGNEPGTFEVFGVEKSTGNDTRQTITAESPVNARVKAELGGMVVTSIRRISR